MARQKPASPWEGDFDYLKLMAAEVEKSYTPGTTFREESHQHVNRKFRAHAARQGPVAYGSYNDIFLRYKLIALRRRYHMFSELLSREGISWNSEANILYGNHRLLVQNYKYAPEFGGYIGGEEHFDLMYEVFGRGVYFEI